MFNVYVFQQSALVLVCLVMLIVSVFTVRYHQWWSLRIAALGTAIIAAATILGLICA